MLWRSDTPRITVLFGDRTWAEFADEWRERVQARTRGDPPAGRYAPIRGFGNIWGNDDGVHSRLGWATGPERGFCAKVQHFERGFALASEGVEDCLEGKYNMARQPDFTPLLFIVDNSRKWQRY